MSAWFSRPTSRTGSKRVRVRRWVSPAVAAVLSCSLVACGSGSGSDTDDDAVLTIGLPAGPVSLDPSRDSQTFAIIRPLANEFLTHEAADGTIQPGLAASWRYLDDEFKVFEFTLREGAKFSDGTAVDAESVKTWLEYFAKGTGIFVSVMGPIEAIEAVDELTVKMTLAEPNPTIPYLFSENGNWGAVSSPKAVADPQSLATSTAGAGPYMLDTDRTVTDQKYVFVPNPHYDKTEDVEWTEVVVEVMPDANARLQAQQTGQIDIALGDLATADAAEDAGLDVEGIPSSTAGLTIADRDGDGPLGDARVRQALNYAIDRDAIAQGLVKDLGEPTSQIASRDGEDEAYQDYYAYDVERAKDLLAEAGYADGFTIKVLELGPVGKVGTPLGQAIASYWSELGVKADIQSAATPAEYTEKRATKQYPAMYLSGIRWPIYTTFKTTLAPGGGINPFGASDPTMNALFAQGASSDDPQIWLDMSRRVVEEGYFVPVFNLPRLYYVSDTVTGVELTEQRPEYSWATEWSPK